MMIIPDQKRFHHVGKSLLVVLATCHATAMAQKIISPCPCYSVQVGPAEQTVKIGDAIRINVEVTNTVDHDIDVEQDSRHPGDLYFVDVRDTSGVRQRMTDSYSETTRLLHPREAGEPADSGLFRGEDGKIYLRTYRGSNEPLRILKPGDKATATILLNDLYKLDKVGTYNVQLKRIEGKEEIDSNFVIVKIITESGMSAQEAPNNDSLAVWVEMQQEQIPIGQTPLAVLTMKNMSDRAVSIHEYMYRAHVDVKDGESPTTLVQRSITGKHRPGEAALRADEMSGPYAIWPDESLVRKFMLSYLYDLSVPGKYTVYCEVMDPLSHRWVRTKPVTFEMLEKPRP